MDIKDLKNDLKKMANSEKARVLKGFFKTGKGQYGEGDIFLGITVPKTKAITKRYSEINTENIRDLLSSNVHEYRLAGLLILLDKFNKSDNEEKEKIFRFYIDNTKFINNWDLVDLTAHKIVGKFLKDKKRDLLYELAKSQNLWEKRISIISCLAYIKDNDFRDALKIAEILLNDNHDLIHKAVGWVLREIWKKDEQTAENFLRKNYKKIPRTTLRYAIERFPEEKRVGWLRGEIK